MNDVSGPFLQSNQGTARASQAIADTAMMRRAVELAHHGAGRVRPNPLVGAVVVQGGEIVGEGYHAAVGMPHAEVVALDAAADRSVGSTLYCTLEPCTHYGKTPPCVERIVESRVARVVIAMLDPDPRVSGRGVETLRRRGIDVAIGVSIEAALALNIGYVRRTMNFTPAVTLKMAVTLDGRIASRPGARDTISGGETQEFVHRLRAENDAVLVGIETFLVDRPLLDCRCLPGVDAPVPVVLDSRGRFDGHEPWAGRRFIVVGGSNPELDARIAGTRGRHVVAPVGEGGVDIVAGMKELQCNAIGDVLVEGGSRVFSSFARAGLWDVMVLAVAPKMFGENGVPMMSGDDAGWPETRIAEERRYGNDVVITYLNPSRTDELLDRLGRNK